MSTDEDARVEAARLEARERQYASYVQHAERLVDRRAEANRFYVTLNLAIVGAMGFLFSDHFTGSQGAPPAGWMAAALGFAGLVVSMNWRSVIASQRRIMAWKFDVVHALEASLPSQPYKDEWALTEAARRTAPASRFEQRLPTLFMLFFVLALMASLAHGLGLDAGALLDRIDRLGR